MNPFGRYTPCTRCGAPITGTPLWRDGKPYHPFYPCPGR